MKILIATDSFKGSLSSKEACETIKNAFCSVIPEANVSVCPTADGGEGTLCVLTEAFGGEIKTVTVRNPLMKPVSAHFGVYDDTSVIEMSAASGITLLKDNELNPFVTSTYGTGEMVKAALNRGSKRIIIGIGGSATNDGGTGFLRALGASFSDKNGAELAEGGKALSDLAEINLSGFDKRIKNTEFIVACDVTSPLCGENGASKVFARQKGADDKGIEILEASLKNYAEVCARFLGCDYSVINGSGASGGLGFALKAFCGARLEAGFSVVARETHLEEKIAESDIIITGEGKTDCSTLLGKLPICVSDIAKKHSKKCLLLSGDLSLSEEELKKHFHLFKKARLDTDTVNDALINAKSRLFDASVNLAEIIKNGVSDD